MTPSMKKPLTFIDLFCGCGGFSLGLARAGFQGLAAIDFNHEAIQVYQANFKDIPQILEKDLTAFVPEELESLIGTSEVDLIVGGPPCQGFSTARQVDGANHGERLKEDPRRHLYKEFLRHVEHFKPKVFVMENVLGIRSASGGIYFSKVQSEARALGYRVHAQIEDCVDLGVPQKRRRQLFVGTRLDLNGYFRPILEPASRSFAGATLWDAIGDLPTLNAGEGAEECEYDHLLRFRAYSKGSSTKYLDDVLEVNLADKLTAHRARPHSDRDLRDFLLLKEGENSAEAIRRNVEFEFPYDKSSFKDRYTRQHRDRSCSTIVAHLAKDGLMFIHPTQNRSLTPREAARIQSFPDWFIFPVARTHQFRLIGNAVPPLVGEAVGLAVKDYIENSTKMNTTINFDIKPLPRNQKEAVSWILPILYLDSKALRKIPDDTLKQAWFAIGFIYMGLHPDSALEHGTTIIEKLKDVETYLPISQIEPLLCAPYYEQSGWPVILSPLAKEAWRRYENELIKDDEFYCCDAQMAGACYRNKHLVAGLKQGRKMFA